MIAAEVEPLPLKRIVLFTSGVGFFDHLGEVDGNRRADFRFNVSNVNDLLKSMVVQDLNGGNVSAVNYSAKDPTSKTLRTFTVNLTTNPTQAEMLHQLRGNKTELTLKDGKVQGTIMSVERRSVPAEGNVAVNVEYINLFTATGLRAIPLSQVQEIQLIDDKLNQEIQQALSVLSQAAATEKKLVSLDLRGTGKRQVRVGYIQEAPVWKTSYRLVIDEGKPPFLQGWAIVENTTDHAWKNVQLTLISGRPISFLMDLYQPMYVDRPTVVPEHYATLRPQAYDQDMLAAAERFRQLGEPAPAGNRVVLGPHRGGQFGSIGGMGGSFGGGGNFAGADGGGIGGGAFGGALPPVPAINPAQGVMAAAVGQEIGELFRYVIDKPVDVSSQQSAMLPIVNESIEGDKVAIYNATVHSKHPLDGFKLKNTSRLHLMQGPITVFDGGEYAGDARIADVAPGAERLISYALDLNTEVISLLGVEEKTNTELRIFKGTVTVNSRELRQQTYTIKNSGSHKKRVLIEHPIDVAWKLVQPAKLEELTSSLYRFATTAEQGKPTTLTVAEEQRHSREIVISFATVEELKVLARSSIASPAFKKAIETFIEMNDSLSQLTRDRSGLEAARDNLASEQARIRENMRALSTAPNSDLMATYIKRMTSQEAEFETLRGKLAAAKEAEKAAQQAISEYLANLIVK